MGRRPGLPENDRHRAIGMVDAGMSVADVAAEFHVHRATFWRLINRFRQTGTSKDRPRSGRPKKLTPREERYVRLTSTRDKFIPATRVVHRLSAATGVCVSAQTVRNRLHRLGIHARRPHQGMKLTPNHQHQRLVWTNRHLRWLNRDWITCKTTYCSPDDESVPNEQQVNVLDWPSRSPDLNPIEHVWDLLNRRIRENHGDFQNLQELENALIREWNAIPQRQIRKILNGMRKRCQSVIDARGAWTRY
ncbi:uncharacterized protein [Mytilus edulis]|uniref:uncharacterized protein n=1 Tax=Mytilus edulis TaxID=6550 RepID=UPI0039EE7FA8